MNGMYGIKKNTQNKNFTPKIDAALTNQTPLFNAAALPQDAQKILDTFDEIVQGVRPLSAKQLHFLPNTIRDLSHSLTDERGKRRLGYMKDTQLLSAYTRYFSWWNLVRLTRLFANLPSDAFHLDDGDVCLDVGSGPLTVVCALWLARPELRAKKLTWYCMDISKSALALGEDLFLSIVAKTENGDVLEHWQIIRVTGALGAATIKEKASFITCANMFNEMYQDTNEPPEFSAKKYSEALLSYATDDARVLVVEPGIPKTARFISLMRDSFLRKKMRVVSPCPHAETCPMNGAHAHRGGNAKWCNFSFNTDGAKDVPAALQKLSEAAQLGKYRAVMSFVFATRASAVNGGVAAADGRAVASGRSAPSRSVSAGEQNSRLANVSYASRSAASESIFRIASEPIKLAYGDVGFYACGAEGLALIVNKTQKDFASGDLISVAMNSTKKNFQIDKKSGAKIIVVGEELKMR